jgi:hypothetical protein
MCRAILIFFGWDLIRRNNKYNLCSTLVFMSKISPVGAFCWPCILPRQGKDIVFRFIIEYSSLRDFYRPLGNNTKSIFIWGLNLKYNILACVETWDISYRIKVSWRILVSFRGFFEDYIFAMVIYIWVFLILLLLPQDTFKCKWQQGHSVTHPLFNFEKNRWFWGFSVAIVVWHFFGSR